MSWSSLVSGRLRVVLVVSGRRDSPGGPSGRGHHGRRVHCLGSTL